MPSVPSACLRLQCPRLRCPKGAGGGDGSPGAAPDGCCKGVVKASAGAPASHARPDVHPSCRHPPGHRQRMIGGTRSCRPYRPWRRMPLPSRFTHRRHPLGVGGACLACLVTAARTVPGCPEGAEGVRISYGASCRCSEGRRQDAAFGAASIWRSLSACRHPPGTSSAGLRPNHSRSRLRCPKGAGGGGAPGRCPKGAGRVPTSLFRLPPVGPRQRGVGL